MSDKPTVTRYSSSTTEAVEVAWKLKQMSSTHEARQRELMEEYRAKSMALTDKMQAEQSAVFDGVRRLMGIPDADWGNGRSWAMSIEDINEGTVALIHETDPSRTRDDCNCPTCQVRRALKVESEREDKVKPVFH